MHRTFCMAAALTLLTGAALAQTPPAPRFVPVPDNAILSTNLEGLAVYNTGNEKVGTIRDMVVASGRLSGYVLSVGGFLGLGDRDVVVDPAGLAVSYNSSGKAWHARIDATKDQLKAAPAFVYDGRWSK